MNDTERMYAIREAAWKIVECAQAEGLAFISERQLRALEHAADTGQSRMSLHGGITQLRERTEDVVRIVTYVLDEMAR